MPFLFLCTFLGRRIVHLHLWPTSILHLVKLLQVLANEQSIIVLPFIFFQFFFNNMLFSILLKKNCKELPWNIFDESFLDRGSMLHRSFGRSRFILRDFLFHPFHSLDRRESFRSCVQKYYSVCIQNIWKKLLNQ